MRVERFPPAEAFLADTEPFLQEAEAENCLGVAALSRLLLENGNEFCCLYTDLANTTSNAIYGRIGYRAVSDAGVYTLVD